MISPDYFKDRFMDAFGPVAYVLQHCGIYFSVLFFKLFIDVVVIVLGHLEKTKMTGASLVFGYTLLSASKNIFVMSVLTSMFDSRGLPLAAVEKQRKTFCNEEELNVTKGCSEKKKNTSNP